MPNTDNSILEKLNFKSITDFTLSSLHVAQVRIKCVKTVQHVSCLFEVVDVLKRPE